MKKLNSLLKRNNGQSLIMVALLMVAILGFAAIVIDVGMMSLTKADLQNAADAAALAGAMELPDSSVQADTAAKSYAAGNGKTGDTTVVKVAADKKSVSVGINRTEPTFFGKLLGVEENVLSADATASVGVAGSVPWIVPFVIPKPAAFDFDHVYVMRMYGSGDFLDFPKTASNKTGYPSDYSYPNDYRTDSVYKNYPISNPYPYQFDYMNVYIEQNTNFSNYIYWLENGYHKTFTINQKMYYLGPSSGGRESVDAFAKRISKDPNTDYTKAKLGDGRVMLIPVVQSMLKRDTSTSGNVSIKIIGFAGFFLQKVHKNSYGESFWFEGRFLEDFNVGYGEVTYDANADFGLRVQKLSK
jgi:hypothetical protein